MNKLFWKAFVLYVMGIFMACNLLLLPVLLLVWKIFGTIPADLGPFYTIWFCVALLTGIVGWVLEDFIGDANQKERLQSLAEEGRLTIIYGNVFGALYIIWRILSRNAVVSTAMFGVGLLVADLWDEIRYPDEDAPD